MSSKPPAEGLLRRPATKVFVATTVMLTFITYWQAAAIVLADLASSAFYVGGIAEQAIGTSAPWLVLAVMVFSYAVRALYIESSTMFVRGGVYRVVKEALGSRLAKVAVSALMFDFLLTGPISAVSAGQYLAGFLQDLFTRLGYSVHVAVNSFSAVFAILVTVYFWWKNIQGIHETSQKAMRVMQITTIMVVIMIVWGLYTVIHIHAPLPPLPTVHNTVFGPDALGWLKGSSLTGVAGIVLLIGFGHSILAMSGEETLAQVYRDIKSPKAKNLEKAGMVIFIYTVIFTPLAVFFSAMIIPGNLLPKYYDNLIGGMAMYLTGPYTLRLIFQAFVVFVGALILSGAVNTAIIGSTGVLSRVSEDGVLTDWFRRPHRHYGTVYRIINAIVMMQLIVIVITWGNVYELGEGYAFGLVWSFTFLAVSVLVLRFTQPAGREWRIPANFKFGKTEIPLGVIFIAIVLTSTAVINLFTKEIATIAGSAFTAGFFVIFVVSEQITKRQRARDAHLEKFRIAVSADLGTEPLNVRPGNLLVTVRDPRSLHHLEYALAQTDTVKQDIVVMTVRLFRSFAGPAVVDEKRAFDQYEQELFTQVVAIAEKAGKPVSLLVVPGSNAYHTIVATAQRLESSVILEGASALRSVEDQAKLTGDAWEDLPEPRPRLELRVLSRDNQLTIKSLGPHTPRLRPEDLDLLHNLWLEITANPEYRGLHHYDVVALALKELQGELHSQRREELMESLRELAHIPRYPPGPPQE
ncbi:MAG: APC family permease [Acidobacteria bacterium]|nr:MAG: APC family permease [Acidobacteriota bacterium]